MISYPTQTRRRRPLLHTLCAVVLVFSLAISPVTVFAEGEVPPTVDTTTTAALTETTPPPDASPLLAVPEPTITPEPTTSPDPTPVATAEAAPTESIGPQSPTGADSNKYVLNPETGLWENDKYTWDPSTNQTKPKVAPSYSFNPITNQWDTTQWRYDAPSGKYVENVVSVPAPPDGAIILTADPSETTGTSQQAKSTSAPLTSAIQSQNSPSSKPTSSGIFDLFYNASISNVLDSQATSGNALVAGNTIAGDAITGTATAIATILNLLQSTWDYAANGSLTTFVSNLFGDVFGDILIDPGTLDESLTVPPDQLTVNASGSGQITNDINLGATSGDATVTKNTQAGNATSGQANVIANIINSIGSSVTAGKSFLGILNIFGDFDGDILIPSQLLSLLGSPSDVSAATSSLSSLTAATNQTIANTVTSDASSGSATVDKNTSAGNATTGNASTSVNILNLTGRQIIGKDALLVFINVLGSWLGLIVNAPVGANTAVLGDASGSNAVSVPDQLTTQDNQTITNNLALTAHSGDATVAQNTSAGNATTGNASTTANIVNMENSNLALTDWFGILFINIFGNWHGSFGIDTDAGETAVTPNNQTGDTTSVQSSSQSQISSSSVSRHITHFSSTVTGSDQGEQTGAILASAIVDNGNQFPLASSSTAKPSDPEAGQGLNTFSIVGTLFGLSLLAAERTYTYRDKIRLVLSSKLKNTL